jgi:hypothetical protein
MRGRVGLDIDHNFQDGMIRFNAGVWWHVRWIGDPPQGFRGQWSGWVEYPISVRKARRILRKRMLS